MRRSNSMTETLEDREASIVESFLEITMTIATLAVGAGACSGMITLALMS
jgi:hypothetical protein